MSDIFVCKHCDKEMGIKQFGRHLWKIHNQKYEDYVKDNLDDFRSHGWQPCIICGTISKKKTCSRECFKQHCSNLKTGIVFGPMAAETKKKLSDNRKEKYALGWSPRVGKLHTEESKQKNAAAHLGKKIPSISGILNPACRPEVKEKISKTMIENGYSIGEKNGMYGKTHTPEAIKKIFSHRKMNKLETLVAEQLDKASISYHFQYFINDDGVCKSYDFKIKDKPLIIEVDGDFWHGNPLKPNHYDKVDDVRENDKLKDEMARKQGIQVIRLWESDIKKDPSIVLKHVI